MSCISESGPESFLNISMDCDPQLQFLNFLTPEDCDISDKLVPALESMTDIDFDPVVITPDVVIKQEVMHMDEMDPLCDSFVHNSQPSEQFDGIKCYLSSTPMKGTPIKALTFSPSQVTFTLIFLVFCL